MNHRNRKSDHGKPKPRPPVTTTTTTSTTTSTTTTLAPNGPLSTWKVLAVIVTKTDLPGLGPYAMPEVMLNNCRNYINLLSGDVQTMSRGRFTLEVTAYETTTPSTLFSDQYNGPCLGGTEFRQLMAQEGVDPDPYDGCIAITPNMMNSYHGEAVGLTWSQMNMDRNGGYSWCSLNEDPRWSTEVMWGLMVHEFTHQVLMWYSRWDPQLPDIDARDNYTWPDGSPFLDVTWDHPERDFLAAVYQRQCKRKSDGLVVGLADATLQNPRPRTAPQALPLMTLPSRTVLLKSEVAP